MARVPHSYIPPGVGNTEENVMSSQAIPFQFPGSGHDTQSIGALQPPKNSGFMQPSSFVPNILPPSMQQSANSGPPTVVNNFYGGGFRPPGFPPFMQCPRWPPYLTCPVPFPGFQQRPGYHYQGVQTPGSPALFNNTVPPPMATVSPMDIVSPSQQWIPNQEDCNRNSVDPEGIGEVTGTVYEGMDSDQIWVRSWLQSRVQGPSAQSSSIAASGRKLKLWEVKKSLQDCWAILCELEDLEEELTTKCKELEETDWNRKLKEVSLKKALLEKKLNVIGVDELKSIKAILSKRGKKRARQKRKRVFDKESALLKAENRKKLHLEIDMWLEKQQAEVDLIKQEESMKQEADAVLWGVRRKQSEGRKILSLLSALVKLYHVRSKKKECSTNPVPSEDKEQFLKIIDKLVHLWEGQMKDYEAEEKTLRVMLQETPEKGEGKGTKDDLKSDLSKVEKNNREWEVMLFGDDSTHEQLSSLELDLFRPFYSRPCKSLDAFIETRRHWDQFISTSNSPASSSIPVGWVVPKEASSKEWKELTK